MRCRPSDQTRGAGFGLHRHPSQIRQAACSVNPASAAPLRHASLSPQQSRSWPAQSLPQTRSRRDLRPNSTMTNATVSQSVVSNDGHTLLIKYKDGEKKVSVPPETPVVTYVPADRSELKAGAKIIAFMKKLPDGTFEATRVSIGLGGLTPPM